MYDRKKYRKPLQHRQALFSRLSWYSWKILSKTNYTLRNEYGCISGYEFRYVVNQHSENNTCTYDFLTLRQNLKVRYQVTGTIQRLNLNAWVFLLFTLCVVLIYVSIKCCFLLLIILYTNKLNQFILFTSSHFAKKYYMYFFTLFKNKYKTRALLT